LKRSSKRIHVNVQNLCAKDLEGMLKSPSRWNWLEKREGMGRGLRKRFLPAKKLLIQKKAGGRRTRAILLPVVEKGRSDGKGSQKKKANEPDRVGKLRTRKEIKSAQREPRPRERRVTSLVSRGATKKSLGEGGAAEGKKIPGASEKVFQSGGRYRKGRTTGGGGLRGGESMLCIAAQGALWGS